MAKSRTLEPKERALEVYYRFYNINSLPIVNNGINPYISRTQSIQCALILVDENIFNFSIMGDRASIGRMEYWEKVKLELIKLIQE